MSETEKVIQKIKKLLALSRSPNEHEAALALSKAQEMMAAHSVTTETIRMAEVVENSAAASVKKSPSSWESRLFNLVSDAFGCQGIFNGGIWGKGEWVFIEITPAPEIAAYAFQALQRQAQTARRDYVKRLKRLELKTKRRRGNIFVKGWVDAVADKITTFAGADQTALIESYIDVHYPNLTELKPRDRRQKIQHHDWTALNDGRTAGEDARLNHGVGSGGGTLALS